MRKPIDRKKADPLTKLYILTLLAGEQQTMNFYMNLGNTLKDQVGRGLYQEIAMIEEQHVTQYESLLDPQTPWIENALLHEYNECWLYWSFLDKERDPQVKPIWELHLEMEMTHLHTVADIARKMDVEPEQVVPRDFPRAAAVQVADRVRPADPGDPGQVERLRDGNRAAGQASGKPALFGRAEHAECRRHSQRRGNQDEYKPQRPRLPAGTGRRTPGSGTAQQVNAIGIKKGGSREPPLPIF